MESGIPNASQDLSPLVILAITIPATVLLTLATVVAVMLCRRRMRNNSEERWVLLKKLDILMLRIIIQKNPYHVLLSGRLAKPMRKVLERFGSRTEPSGTPVMTMSMMT